VLSGQIEAGIRMRKIVRSGVAGGQLHPVARQVRVQCEDSCQVGLVQPVEKYMKISKRVLTNNAQLR
jgi:hypothetical protein